MGEKNTFDGIHYNQVKFFIVNCCCSDTTTVKGRRYNTYCTNIIHTAYIDDTMSEYAGIETSRQVRRKKMGLLMKRIRSTGIHSMYAQRRKRKSKHPEAEEDRVERSGEVLNDCDRSKTRPTAVPITTTQYCGSSVTNMMGFGWLLGACFGDTYSVDKSGDDGLEYKTCDTPKTAEISQDDDYDEDSDHVDEDDDDDDDDSSGGSTQPSASRVNQVLLLPAINMKEDGISDISSSSSEDSSWSSDSYDSDESKSKQGVRDHQKKKKRMELIIKRRK